MTTITDFLETHIGTQIQIAGGLWVRVRNNDTAVDYYSTATSDPATGAFTITAPPGMYALYTGNATNNAATVPGTPTLQTSYYAIPVTAGDDVVVKSLTGKPSSPYAAVLADGVTATPVGVSFGKVYDYGGAFLNLKGSGSVKVDGATDDTAALNTLLAALPATGGTLYWYGALVLSGTVTVPGTISDLTLIGAGPASEMRLGALGTLVLGGSTRVTIADCKITSTSTGTINGSIFGQGSHSPRILNVRFEGGGHHVNFNTVDKGWLIMGTTHKTHHTGSATDLFIFGSTEGSIVGLTHESSEVWPTGSNGTSIVLSTGTTRVDIVGGSISGLDFTNCTTGSGVSFAGAQYCTLVGMVISNLKNGDGVVTQASAADIDIVGVNSSNNNLTTGAGIQSGTGDGFDIFNSLRIRLVGCTGRFNGIAGTTTHINCEIFTSTDVTVDACDFSDGGDAGMVVTGSQDVTIANTIIRRNSKSGIVIQHSTGPTVEVLNLKILGCDISDNNRGANGAGQTADGIYMANQSEADIVDCRITDTGALAAKLQNNGIEIQNSAFARIRGCDVRGNKSAGISDAVGMAYVTDTQGWNPQGSHTPPGIPATTVILANPFREPAMVYVAGGTLTAIGLGGAPIAAAPTLAASASGGTLATLTYGYKVTTLTAAGETAASAEATVAVTGPTGSVTVTVGRVRGAIGYKIYGRTSGGAWGLIGQLTFGLKFVDDGSVTPGAAAPGADSSGNTATGITAAAAAGAVHSLHIPWGGAIKLTYSVAPTWTWFAAD